MALSVLDQRLKKFLKEDLHPEALDVLKKTSILIGKENSPFSGVIFSSEEEASLAWLEWAIENPKEYKKFYSRKKLKGVLNEKTLR